MKSLFNSWLKTVEKTCNRCIKYTVEQKREQDTKESVNAEQTLADLLPHAKACRAKITVGPGVQPVAPSNAPTRASSSTDRARAGVRLVLFAFSKMDIATGAPVVSIVRETETKMRSSLYDLTETDTAVCTHFIAEWKAYLNLFRQNNLDIRRSECEIRSFAQYMQKLRWSQLWSHRYWSAEMDRNMSKLRHEWIFLGVPCPRYSGQNLIDSLIDREAKVAESYSMTSEPYATSVDRVGQLIMRVIAEAPRLAQCEAMSQVARDARRGMVDAEERHARAPTPASIVYAFHGDAHINLTRTAAQTRELASFIFSSALPKRLRGYLHILWTNNPQKSNDVQRTGRAKICAIHCESPAADASAPHAGCCPPELVTSTQSLIGSVTGVKRTTKCVENELISEFQHEALLVTTDTATRIRPAHVDHKIDPDGKCAFSMAWWSHEAFPNAKHHENLVYALLVAHKNVYMGRELPSWKAVQTKYLNTVRAVCRFNDVPVRRWYKLMGMFNALVSAEKVAAYSAKRAENEAAYRRLCTEYKQMIDLRSAQQTTLIMAKLYGLMVAKSEDEHICVPYGIGGRPKADSMSCSEFFSVLDQLIVEFNGFMVERFRHEIALVKTWSPRKAFSDCGLFRGQHKNKVFQSTPAEISRFITREQRRTTQPLWAFDAKDNRVFIAWARLRHTIADALQGLASVPLDSCVCFEILSPLIYSFNAHVSRLETLFRAKLSDTTLVKAHYVRDIIRALSDKREKKTHTSTLVGLLISVISTIVVLDWYSLFLGVGGKPWGASPP